jgi:toxin ParE1/3/4
MARVLRTSKAEEDLLEIWSYVGDDSPDAADRLLDDIDQACTLLAEMPQAGRTREELGPNLRSLAVGNYVIFYRAADDSIVVIRVLHGARDLPGLL